MTDNQRPVVGKIIATFKSRISDSACKHISSARFTDLAIMIDEAISEEMASAAALVEDLAKTLRAGARRPELGL